MMDRDTFIGICEKIKGYDGIIMTDTQGIYQTYSFKPKTLLYRGMAMFETGRTWVGARDTNPYSTAVGAKVLCCTHETIGHYANRKLRLLNALKDYHVLYESATSTRERS